MRYIFISINNHSWWQPPNPNSSESSFFLFSLSFDALIIRLFTECTLTSTLLPLAYWPLPLQLFEQIRSQQSIFNQAACQRFLRHLCQASLTSASGCSSAGASRRVALCLKHVGDVWVSGSDQTGDVTNALLDDVIEFLLDSSDCPRVWKHIHETVAAGACRRQQGKGLDRVRSYKNST